MKGLHSTFGRVLKCASLCGLFIFSQPSFAASNHSAATAQPAILQNYLVQERKAAGLSSKTVQIGNITWSYNEGGSRANPSILLIHGLAGNRDNWNRVAHYLTPYYHVIFPDLPTNGDTQVPENFDISIPNVTEQLRQFVEKIDSVAGSQGEMLKESAIQSQKVLTETSNHLNNTFKSMNEMMLEQNKMSEFRDKKILEELKYLKLLKSQILQIF